MTKKIELTDDNMMFLISNGFLTGSRVYGKPDQNSDLDIVVDNHYGSMYDYLERLGFNIDEETFYPINGFTIYANYGDLVVNIIGLPKTEFEVWEKAKNIMEYLAREKGILKGTNKEIREAYIAICELVR